jgi:hypothetical protein
MNLIFEIISAAEEGSKVPTEAKDASLRNKKCKYIEF